MAVSRRVFARAAGFAALFACAHAGMLTRRCANALVSDTEGFCAAHPEALGVLPTTLWGGRVQGVPTSQLAETNLGDLAAEALHAAAHDAIAGLGIDDGTPLVTLADGACLATPLARGPILPKDLARAVPGIGLGRVVRATPAMLWRLLETGLRGLGEVDASTGVLAPGTAVSMFPQIAGINVWCDPRSGEGSRLIDVQLTAQGGLSRDDDATPLYLAMTPAVANEPANRVALAGAQRLADLPDTRNAVHALLADLAEGIGAGALPYLPGTKGRLALMGLEGGAWEARIAIADPSGLPAAYASVELEVDAVERRAVMTDGAGIARITVADGAHAIRLIADDDDAPVPVSLDDYGVANRDDTAALAASALAWNGPEVLVDSRLGLGLEHRPAPRLVLA